jgi:DNA-binding response OmpR family regulator
MARRLLYIDDEETCAQLAMRKLRGAGYVVDWAADGEQALERLAREPYDVLAIDHRMPKMDGMEVVRTLADRGVHPPMIMITGTGYEELAVEALRLGVKDYIIKDLEGHYINLLPAVLEQVFKEQALIQEKEQAIHALKRSEEALRRMNDELEQRVTERTAALKEANGALMEKVQELESFTEVVVGRELKMMEMKKELERLRDEVAALRAAQRTG